MYRHTEAAVHGRYGRVQEMAVSATERRVADGARHDWIQVIYQCTTQDP